MFSTLFSPITEAISVVRKNIFQNDTGSLKTKNEINTAPTAPIPVQTGYATPTGMPCTAFAKSTALKTYNNPNAEIHAHHWASTETLALPRQNVKAVSHSPAAIRKIQLITKNAFRGLHKYHGDSFRSKGKGKEKDEKIRKQHAFFACYYVFLAL